MRALLLAFLLVIPLATALPTVDTREVVANRVHPTQCPGMTGPATVACYTPPAGAVTADLEVKPDLGSAQPRLRLRLYDGNVLLNQFWACNDPTFGLPTGTDWIVVELHDSRTFCGDSRQGIVAHGKIIMTWS